MKNHYSRDFRIWQTRIDRNVCKNRRKTSDWRLLLNFFSQWFFSIESCLLRFRWYYNQNFLWTCRIVNVIFARNKIYCFVLSDDFHANDLVESNCCKIDVFKNTFRRRLKNWLSFDNCFSWNTACALAWNQEIKSIDVFCELVTLYNLKNFENIFWCNSFRIAIRFVASAHSSRKRRNYFCFRVCTFWKKTSMNDNSWNVWFLSEYIITYKFRRFVKNLSCKRISETKSEMMYSTICNFS